MRFLLLLLLVVGCWCIEAEEIEIKDRESDIKNVKPDTKEESLHIATFYPKIKNVDPNVKENDPDSKKTESDVKEKQPDIKGKEPKIETTDPVEEKVKGPPYIVHFKKGVLEGYQTTSQNGNAYYGFRSIPYAIPPVGERRFTEPKPHLPYTEVVDARPFPTPCPQFDMEDYFIKGKISYFGEEDCLYLSVYTPEINEDVADLPVMVFFPGMAYVSAKSEDYDPSYFMDERVVLVVLQYRLGIFGFMSTDDLVVQGNFGLMDQTVAMRWVRDNIGHFGGNNLRITLFGQGTGSAMVHFQMLSPHATGLYQKTILQSGSALCPWAMGGIHREVAFHLGQQFNCSADIDEPEETSDGTSDEHASEKDTKQTDESANKDEEEPIEDKEAKEDDSEEPISEETKKERRRRERSKGLRKCLQKVDAKTLALKIIEYYSWGVLPIIFGPIADGRYLPEAPEYHMYHQRHKRADMLIGITKDEGTFITNAMFANERLRLALKYSFPDFAPISLEFTDEDFAPVNMSISAFDYYVGGLEIDESDAYNITKLYGDRHQAVCADLTAMLHYENNQNMKKNVYLYEFHHRGEKSTGDAFNLMFGKDLVSHGDELLYLFPNTSSTTLNEDDEKVARLIIKLWTTFASTGEPTPEGSDFNWTLFTPDNPSHLVISTEPHMESDTRGWVRSFWTSLPTKQNILMFPGRVGNLTETETSDDESEEETTDSESVKEKSNAQSVNETPVVSPEKEPKSEFANTEEEKCDEKESVKKESIINKDEL